MTIRRGEEWGAVGPAPDGVIAVSSDAELGSVVRWARERDAAIPPCALLGGDLMRTVGGTGDRDRLRGEMVVMTVDVVKVETDAGAASWFVAHLLARRSWWRGPVTAAMNAEFMGAWDVAPRSHPNDGRVDVVEVSDRLRVRQRWAARGRLASGTHVPHPDITIRSTSTLAVDLPSRTRLWLDGVVWERARRIVLTVEPDAMVVCV
jgi:hypothetical protein